jgi:hypothetical protein
MKGFHCILGGLDCKIFMDLVGSWSLDRGFFRIRFVYIPRSWKGNHFLEIVFGYVMGWGSFVYQLLNSFSIILPHELIGHLLSSSAYLNNEAC